MLEAALANRSVSLVIIDPISRFVRVSDNSEYMPVSDALEMILDLGRRYGVHVVVVHHLKKRMTEDPMDSALGSTAIAAACDTFIALQSDRKGQRSICTRQRYGVDLEPTLLDWIPESREFAMGITCEEPAELAASRIDRRIEDDMKTFISDNPDSTQEVIIAAVCAKVVPKKHALQQLLEDGIVIRSGAGAKGGRSTIHTSIELQKSRIQKGFACSGSRNIEIIFILGWNTEHVCRLAHVQT